VRLECGEYAGEEWGCRVGCGGDCGRTVIGWGARRELVRRGTGAHALLPHVLGPARVAGPAGGGGARGLALGGSLAPAQYEEERGWAQYGRVGVEGWKNGEGMVGGGTYFSAASLAASACTCTLKTTMPQEHQHTPERG
jgi:hypothetical protein